MIQQRPITTHQLVCVCDRCGREMDRQQQDIEWSERLSISFRGGYGSIFGDGNIVECDLCQHCVKEILERYLRITHDEPFDPKHKPQAERYRIYQDYQLREESQLAELREEFERMMRTYSKKMRERELRELEAQGELSK